MKKTKNVKITEELHKELKVFCAVNSLKMSDFIEKTIKKSITKYDIK